MNKITKGYKAFNKDLTCRGFQYELEKDFYHKGEISLCQSGFHFCKSLGDVYSYYAFGTDIVVCEVESEGEVIDEEGGKKSVTNHIRVVRMLNAEQASNNNGVNNVGHSNTGDRNTGHSNTGDRNTGHRNTGDRNTGDWNTGDRNTGHSNTGDRNTGHRNTGHRNTGHWNTGHWNTESFHTGSFNTKKVETVLVFNQPCLKEIWDNADKPFCLYFETRKWVGFEDMTKSEVEKFPSAKTVGGYYKEIPYKKAFTESMKKAPKGEIEKVKALPNFDAKVFYEISGFKIE